MQNHRNVAKNRVSSRTDHLLGTKADIQGFRFKQFSIQDLCINLETMKERIICMNRQLFGLKMRTFTVHLWVK